MRGCRAYAPAQERHPKTFRYHATKWGKFPDGTDNIKIGGFEPENHLRGSNVIFLASFHSNDATLSQLYVCIALLESLVESLTIVLPFYPVGTMGEWRVGSRDKLNLR